MRCRVMAAFALTGVMLLAACGDDDTPILGAPQTSVATTGSDVEPTEQPESTADPGPTGSFDLDEALIEQAIVDAESDPLDGLSGRDTLATSLLISELTAIGFDLTGLDLVLYPAGHIPPFLLMGTGDSTPLLLEDGGGEGFLTQVLDSAVVADFGVERLVLQHSSVDDQGPFVMTFSVLLNDLRESVDSGADISDRIAVQMERD